MNLDETLLHSPVGPQWSHIGVRHHHGINLPLTALHSKDSCGIGEFYDLIPIIDWCASIGMDVIQLLPLNDTGDETSPFFAQSAQALNPLFLSLHKLPNVDEDSLTQLRNFNSLPRVPYHDVQSHKLIFFRTYFDKVGGIVVKEKEFELFRSNNKWVETYALFKVLKSLMSKNHWQTWPLELQFLKKEQFDILAEKYAKEMNYYIFLQFLCYQQMKAVKAYAREKGIFLKGDIPILISPDSADVWRYSEAFDLTLSAGAPPDAYNAEGQSWGLPIFNWDVIKGQNYDWWRTRLSYAANFYDIYRIDHVLGFFRIYAIPNGDPAKNGRFIPEKEENWLSHGSEILSIIVDHSPMLPIAEDLGTVPPSVRTVLNRMGICGTKVMRWEKTPNEEHFISPMHYNPVSMTTVSTHDSETLELWWENSSEEAESFAHQKGWQYTPHLTKPQRREILWDSHHSSSLFHINLIGEYLALFPELVWDDPRDERINVPGVVAPTNWTYRIRPSVEEIIAHTQLAEEMRNLL